MYIKVIQPKGLEEIHECESVTISPVPGEEDTFVFFDMEPRNRSLCIEMATTSVYLMSNTGQTIESYRWPKEKKEKERNE